MREFTLNLRILEALHKFYSFQYRGVRNSAGVACIFFKALVSDTRAPDVSVVKLRQIVMKQKTVEVPKVQFVDTVVDIPVDLQRSARTLQSTQETVEVPRVQLIDKMVDVPAIMQRQVSTTQDTEDPCLAAIGHEASDDLNEAAEPEDHIEHENRKRRVPEPFDNSTRRLLDGVQGELRRGPNLERFKDFDAGESREGSARRWPRRKASLCDHRLR